MFVLSEEGQASEAFSLQPPGLSVPPPPLLAPARLPASSVSKRRLGFTCLASEKSSLVGKGKWHFRRLIRPRTRMEVGSGVRPGGIVGGLTPR